MRATYSLCGELHTYSRKKETPIYTQQHNNPYSGVPPKGTLNPTPFGPKDHIAKVCLVILRLRDMSRNPKA